MRSLLLDACRAGAFGEIRKIGEGEVAVAGFCFLFGKPESELAAMLKETYFSRVLVPMSEEWREPFLSDARYASASRFAMRPTAAIRDEKRLSLLEAALPEGYSLKRMTVGDVPENPFGHGRTYASPEAFFREGAGCAVIREGHIVSAASSFLSYKDCVETDVSTLPEHRGKGLALACGASFLRLCASLGLEAHWDAQDPASRNLAARLGYELDEEYEVFTRREYLHIFK